MAAVTDPRHALLLGALGAGGDAVAILVDGQVVSANAAAAELGDLAAQCQTLASLGGPARLVQVGAGRTLEVTATSVGGEQVVIGRDVTERERLRRALARSDEILAVFAHELKGPLHVIGMICHLIETRAARAEAIDRATLERLSRQVQRLGRLIGGLLDASRVQDGRMVLDIDEVDLALLVRQQAQAAAGARAADLRLFVPGDARLPGDAARLGAVVFQLVDNAARYTAVGTAIKVTLIVDGDHLQLDVVDEGAGLSPAQAARLFSRAPGPLRHGSTEDATEPGAGGHGLGLGLYVAAAAVHLHGGTIAHTPGPRGGARFTVRLPRPI